MAFNKNKTLESALKYLNQGKVTQAISEYQQILRTDPKDQATLMTVGDLYARQGDMPHAIEYFERLAQVYLQDGFNSKAIAIYKKIAKLAPAELDPLERLADLYVQQGVLSEARPLFLQIAEAHLKANRANKAVEVLHRLLEVEPENPRVQMRLAELYNVMGKKQDAAQTYFAYAQRLSERAENEEALKLIERALELESSHPAALFLKARIFATQGKNEQAIAILDNHPEADGGADVTKLLVDLELRSKQIEKAADRARNQLVRGNSHYGLLLKVAEALIERDEPAEALPLLRELRDPMIDVGELDKFQKTLHAATEKLPDQTEALEMFADFCRHTSDPFQLTNTLMKLVDIYTTAGNQERATQVLEELVDRNKDDERLAARLRKVRGDAEPAPKPEPQTDTPTVAASEAHPNADQEVAKEPAPAIQEPPLDEETQTYIAHAITDVDLFSSYGLNQKAIHLLENVLRRAPRHMPTLERLLDLYLGAGNDRRTAELSAWMEQVAGDRGDKTSTERFAEIRKRFQAIVGATTEELLAAPVAPELVVPEFEIPVVAVQPDASSSEASAISLSSQIQSVADGEELDLSDEWEAMVQEVVEPSQPSSAAPQSPDASVEVEASPVENEIPAQTDETVLEIDPAEPEPAPLAEIAPAVEASVEADVFDIGDLASEHAEQVFDLSEPVAEPVAEQAAAESAPPPAEPVSPAPVEFELELTPEPAQAQPVSIDQTSTEDFISELAAEIEGMDLLPSNGTAPRFAETLQSAPAAEIAEPFTQPVATPFEASPLPASVFAESPAVESATASEPGTVEALHQLAEVFQNFRNEMGEPAEETEDLETHYNLGIAYREMGLLDEAIGEFQKVAKAIQKGRPFQYAMNCSTLLAISFLDKGEPKIASLWYKRALDTPGLDPEAILALRYDLAVALELAGESEAALDSFRQVYAMNIDYRDVADRIATLQHQ